jgi:hypothetical protein
LAGFLVQRISMARGAFRGLGPRHPAATANSALNAIAPKAAMMDPGLDLDFVTYSTRRGWKRAFSRRNGMPEADHRSRADNEALSLRLHEREQARLAVASGGGALGRGARVLFHFEQNRLHDFCRRRNLLAAAPHSSRQRKRLPSMSTNFGAGMGLLLPFGVSAQCCAAPLPVGETGGSKGKGGGQGGGSPTRQGGSERAVLHPGPDPGERWGYPGRRAGEARDPFRARGAAPLSPVGGAEACPDRRSPLA